MNFCKKQNNCCAEQTPQCPVYQALEALSKKWALIVLKTLAENPQELRFKDLQQAIPNINTKALSDRLTELDEMGLISRTVTQTKPTAISYQITEKGADLKEIFECLKNWTEKWGKQ